MRYIAISAAGMAFGLALAGAPAVADPRLAGDRTGSVARSNLGGGFIEFLVTGRSGHAPPAGEVAPVYPRAVSRSELPVEPAPLPRQRLASIPVDPDRQVEMALDPKYLPQVVSYDGEHRPGTIIIDTPNRFLYLVESAGKARRYGIGVGRPGFSWAGVKTITRKAEWPDWRPPAQMLQRRPDLPRYMPGGPENPMGARGLYLGSSLYRIHGTNEPHTIGQAVSSGCIRMRNEDVTDLYERVRVGTRVIVM
jgi:lipoprotein-anchoring transpeptidase ErfK/SrfK